jgi:RNA polymerase sigma-70 factor (ECF subfamily)
MALEVSTFEQRVRMTQALPIDWGRIYAEHAPRVYNYFRFRLGTNADVEDLTSRTFEKAWRAREKYNRNLAGFSTWLFKIAQNVAVDHLRARRNTNYRPRTAQPSRTAVSPVDNAPVPLL